MILATPLPVTSLIKGNTYIIEEQDGRYEGSVYKGTFLLLHRNNWAITMINVTKIKNIDKGPDYSNRYRRTHEKPFMDIKLFIKDLSIFYDIEEIRYNAKKAIESMEQRSLDLILKRLINEEFEW
jgi:hypothetical protein